MMGRHPHVPRFGSPGEEDHAAVDEALSATDAATLGLDEAGLRELVDRVFDQILNFLHLGHRMLDHGLGQTQHTDGQPPGFRPIKFTGGPGGI